MTAAPEPDEPLVAETRPEAGPQPPMQVRDPGSWRDPAGFVYRREGSLFRQVAPTFAEDWDRFESSGLARRLIETNVLIGHEVVDTALAAVAPAHAVIRPEVVDPITYPFEWSFSQLKDAALLTLRAQELATETGMTLRDASAYNVQFRGGRAVLIDSLSFAIAEEGTAWAPYRQFCEHFLAPLALMARVDIRLGRLSRTYLDGIPLDLAARLLPRRTRLSFGLGPHVHLHARAQRTHADDAATGAASSGGRLSASGRDTLIESLRTTVEGLRWEPTGTEWADYADHTSYGDAATVAKEDAVRRALERAGGSKAWDLGANTGRYARIAADAGYRVVALDIDPAAVERAYLAVKADGRDILPLLGDLADPSPGLGWASSERRPLLDRVDADVAIGLALVHHLAIGRNVPLSMIASLFGEIAPVAIIEFVPKSDPMVQRLLATREDVFPDYDLEGFQRAFESGWEIVEETPIAGTERMLLELRRRA